MRILIASAGAFLLVACGGNDVPSPTERQQQTADAPAVEEQEILLRGDGLTVGAEAFYFPAGQSEVQTALAELLGKPIGEGENEECGAGPMVHADYSGNLRVNFQNGGLVGWFLDTPIDAVSVVGDVQVGTPRDEALAADGFELFADSTLGEEFFLGSEIGGFLDAEGVSTLYAGTQCFFR